MQLDDPVELLAGARRHSLNRRQVSRNTLAMAPLRSDAPIDTGRRLRVGYLSSDLRRHAVGYALRNFFREHDRGKFEVFAYSTRREDAAESSVQAHIRSTVEHWKDFDGATDVQIAQHIARDEIDILVDLNGHTFGARDGLFALHPAPIVVSWLGFPGSMGTPWHHYIIADPFVIPDWAEHWYSEQVIRLPCYQPNDRERAVDVVIPQRRDYRLPANAFVFACFNNVMKITEERFAVWMTILRSVPESVLWLCNWDSNLRLVWLRKAERLGVEPDRLIITPFERHPKYLARLSLADLSLDTFPYGAHGMGSDALWMGLPVLTQVGRSFASRVCGSLLSAAGVPELICGNADEYVARAIHLAGPGRGELAALHQRLVQNRDKSLLFDTTSTVRSLQNAFLTMRDEYIAGRRPSPRAPQGQADQVTA